MKFLETTLPGVWLIELELRQDDRGFLARTYCEREFGERGLNTVWRQCDLTLTRQAGAVRGLHYQADPKQEIKLLRCSAGRVFDVVLDLRRGGPTFGKWAAFELSEGNQRMLYVPQGLAHGFQCLTDDCELFYHLSEFYVPELARGVRWNDPDVGISWPLPVSMLSERDKGLPLLRSIA